MMRPLPVLALATLAACAGSTSTTSTGTSTPTAQGAARVGRNADIIGETEIAQAQGITNAFDLVRRLRPNFFRSTERTSLSNNSAAPLVRVNGIIMGEVQELKNVEIGVIQEVRYYSTVEAESRWSSERGRPVIAVTTRKLTR